jgi:hypothetical protein
MEAVRSFHLGETAHDSIHEREPAEIEGRRATATATRARARSRIVAPGRGRRGRPHACRSIGP